MNGARAAVLVGGIATSLVVAVALATLVDWRPAPLPPRLEPASTLRPIMPAEPAPVAPYAAAPKRMEWLADLASADVARGDSIMRQGLDRGQVQACTSCHGVNGEPLAGSNVPRLSGQSAYYLVKQLHDYASGARRNAMMTAYARLLTPEQMADVSLAWSRRTTPYVAPAPNGGDDYVRGGLLFAAGDTSRHLPACQNCHGAERTGADSPFPYIGGQHPDYTGAALSDWSQGRRANDAGGVMRHVVTVLGPEDRRAVAAYLATIPPPGAQ